MFSLHLSQINCYKEWHLGVAGAWMVACHACNSEVPLACRNCPACGADNGYPNVRLADEPAEKEALALRVAEAEASAAAGGYLDVLEALGIAVLSSKAIVARALAPILDLLNNGTSLYSTYSLQLAAQSRTPEDNEFDRVRTQFEAALAPGFHREIRFAALTLDDRWLSSFGRYAMVLRSSMIEKRATVFEENPYLFVSRLRVLLNQPLPVGYRATWAQRSDLAKAKLFSKLNTKTNSSEFPRLLLHDTHDHRADYIEVHIFGPFNRNSVAKVVGPKPKTREDRLLWKTLAKSIETLGGTAEQIG